MENNPNVGKQTTTGHPETLEREINQTWHLDEPTLDSLVPVSRVEDVMASDLLAVFGMADDKEQLSLDSATRHILEECRMVLPGIQALFGFQLIAVFNQSDDASRSSPPDRSDGC